MHRLQFVGVNFGALEGAAVFTKCGFTLPMYRRSQRSASVHLIILNCHEISAQNTLIKPPVNQAFRGQKLVKEGHREMEFACLSIEDPALNVDA
jgi:hypothetical protein